MTLVTAVNIKREGNSVIYLCADSRVTQYSSISGKYVSHSDLAQKVILISPNIYIGIAGDYNGLVKALGGLHRRLLAEQEARKSYTEIQEIINNTIKSVWSDTFTATDLHIAIHDMTDEKNRLFKMSIPDYKWYELDEGIYNIGADAQIRANYQYAYKELHKEYKPDEEERFDNRLEANVELLIRTYIVIYNSEINGLVASVCLHDTGSRGFIVEMSPNGGETFIIDKQVSINQWERTINNKKVLGTTTNFKKIWDDLNKRK